MKKSRFFSVFQDLKHKWIFYPSMFVRCLLPFGINLLMASVLLVLFTSAEQGDLVQLYAGLRITALLSVG